MSGEPKTHTPQEALRLLRERGMELTFDSNDATPWAVYRDNGEYLNEYLHFGQTQEEVLSAALGVRVVARDEAAELRALVRRLVKEVGYRTLDWAGTVCSYCGADQPGSEHWEDCIVLVAERRLAGGESQR